MKALFLAIALALCPVVIVTQTGCQSTPQTVAYKSLRAVADGVDASMKAYARAVVAGRVGAETQAKVRDLHGRYQVSLNKAVQLARFDFNAPAPDELAALAADLTETIIAATR